MSTFYWVGGAGTWDNASTTHWAAISGGPAGFGPPTNTDDVIFDSLSNATSYTLTLASTAVCRDVTFGAPLTGTITTSGGITLPVSGSIISSAGLNNVSFNLTMNATTTGKTLTSSGKSFSGINFSGVGGGWTLQDNIALGNFTLTAGALDTNNKNVNCGSCNCSGSAVRSLTLGSSTFTITNVNGGSFLCSFAGSNFTLTANTSTIILTPVSGGGTSAGFGTHTFYNLTFTHSTGYTCFNISGGPVVVSNNLAITGLNASAQRIYIGTGSGSSVVSQTQITITCNGTITSLINVDFEGIVGNGTASWAGGTSIGNCGFNTGITFTAPVTSKWRGDTGILSDPTKWDTGLMPLPHDTAIFDSGSFTATGKTVTNSINTSPGFRMPSMNFTGVTNNPAFANSFSLVMYGSLTFVVGMTYSGVGSLTVSGRSGTITVDTAGLTIIGAFGVATVAATCSLLSAITTSGTFNYYAGTLNTNDFAITCTQFLYVAVSVDRTGNFGASLITLTGTGTVWSCTFGSPLHVINAGTSTIKLTDSSASSKQLSLGPKTYNKIWLSGTGTGIFILNATGYTVADLTIDNPPHRVQFLAAGNHIITAFNVSGTAGNLNTLESTNSAVSYNLVFTQATGIVLCSYLAVQRATVFRSPAVTDASLLYVGRTSTDNGNNLRVNFVDVFTGDLSETNTLTEDMAASKGMSSALSETNTLAESLTALVNRIVGVSEALTLAEAIASLYVVIQGISEAITLTESLSSLYAALAGLSEALVEAEVLSAQMATSRALTEASTLVEELLVSFGGVVPISEDTTIVEVLQSRLDTILAVSEDLNLEETLQAMVAFLALVSEAIDTTESMVARVQFNILLTELQTLGEAVGAALLKFPDPIEGYLDDGVNQYIRYLDEGSPYIAYLDEGTEPE